MFPPVGPSRDGSLPTGATPPESPRKEVMALEGLKRERQGGKCLPTSTAQEQEESMQTQRKLQQSGRNRMFTSHRLQVALLAGLAVVLASASVSLAGSVAICHVPPGNPSNTHVIHVGPAAVKAHVKNHGDAVCAAGDSYCWLTDDGEALCTNLADDPLNCGECGKSCGRGEVCEEGECVSTLCSVPGGPGWGNQIHNVFIPGQLTDDTTAQDCCLACVADSDCSQW